MSDTERINAKLDEMEQCYDYSLGALREDKASTIAALRVAVKWLALFETDALREIAEKLEVRP